MKKILVSVLMIFVCGVLSVANAEMYLFWRIAEDPGVNLDGYHAHIVAAQNGTVTALQSYLSHTATDPIQGSPVAVEAMWDTVSRVSGFENASFFVELFNESGGAYQSEVLSYAELLNYQYISSMEGMSIPGGAWEVKNFHVVPEPTSGVLLLIGVAGLALRRRKMKNA